MPLANRPVSTSDSQLLNTVANEHVALPRVRGGQFAWSIALGALAIFYLSIGFCTLLFDTSFSYPVDLRLRWIEQGLIRQGLNPQEHTYPEHLLPENVNAQKNVRGNYPPWSYTTGLLLAPPIPWPAVRVTFACVSFASIAWIGVWCYRQGQSLGPGWGAVALASALAAFPFCVCLSYGQYSIFVLAMILACFELLRRERMFLAGVALGVAAVKPQLAGLLFLVPMIYPYTIPAKLRFLVGAAVYMAAASFAIAWYVGSTPWEMLGGPANESIKFYHLSNNPLVIWAADAFGFSLGSKLLAMSVAGICALLLWTIRRQNDLLAAFSICSILAMYWSYSRHYDLVLYAVPLMCLLRITTTRHSAAAIVALLLMGLLLWSPIRIELSRGTLIESLAATAGLIAGSLVTYAYSGPRSTNDSDIGANLSSSVWSLDF